MTDTRSGDQSGGYWSIWAEEGPSVAAGLKLEVDFKVI